jgi:hypothetical protein
VAATATATAPAAPRAVPRLALAGVTLGLAVLVARRPARS